MAVKNISKDALQQLHLSMKLFSFTTVMAMMVVKNTAWIRVLLCNNSRRVANNMEVKMRSIVLSQSRL